VTDCVVCQGNPRHYVMRPEDPEVLEYNRYKQYISGEGIKILEEHRRQDENCSLG
jgi:hypothetical protein